ncbi:uncharacterized protein BO66DRAFT_422169 [Aspergillus aculeatinus CBS 121060]|uniref:Uncharacterized protein n=1 Tax=Aspergillus aculeatinus CBS 121060 TaxID=1448322 RepID=A0ACD1H195_9EURO|nr:hypothetical protein BO66DRAFT_422169 [Aspergillus aculeatinus CBS 121060]RAH67365.1 hypothetical protein BO66DRAFT_422169 [Aspergillus aculeatinus CBS 121060]
MIKETPKMHVGASDLKAAGIRHLPLDITNGKNTQNHPRFFQPFQEELPLPENEGKLLEFEPHLDRIMWETRDMELFLTKHFYKCGRYAALKYPHNPPPSGGYREIGDYKFGQLLEATGFNWYAVSVTDYWTGNYPHFKVMLESDAIGDENKLLRGEIMTITDIMAARLRTKSLRPHIVAPILVVSLMGPRHARVLEADYDGKTLNIRASKLYDFTKKNTDAAQLLTRYWLGGACGQTEMEPS